MLANKELPYFINILEDNNISEKANSCKTITALFLKLIDVALSINTKESLEVYKELIELLQDRVSEKVQADYYERHETPEIVAEFINRIKLAPIIPSSYSIYTDEETDLF